MTRWECAADEGNFVVVATKVIPLLLPLLLCKTGKIKKIQITKRNRLGEFTREPCL